MKIIDNLQLSIKNLHVRWEDQQQEQIHPLNNKNKQKKTLFSWGITLSEIKMVTTNAEWEKGYIDRTQEQNK